MDTMEFNGWSNRETWATALWIDNNQALNETAFGWAKNTLEEFDGEPDYRDGIYSLAETLKNWIEEELLTFENVSQNRELWLMLTDIGSLYRVNYLEIAESYIADVKNEQVAS